MYWSYTRDVEKRIIFLEKEAKIYYSREWMLNHLPALNEKYEEAHREYRKKVSQMEKERVLAEHRMAMEAKRNSWKTPEFDDDLPF